MTCTESKDTDPSMPATPEAATRTRAFARVIGPYVTIAAAIVILRTPEMAAGTFLTDVFKNQALIWVVGALLLLMGLIIIAFHQYWSSVAAVLISLFGWFLALRGLVLMVAPQLMERGATVAMGVLPLVQAGFGLLALVGLWLTYVGWIAKPTDN